MMNSMPVRSLELRPPLPEISTRVSNHDIIAIGGSTGALDALKRLFADLPADLPAAVFVVIHVASDGHDLLAGLLDAVGPIPVKTAADGDVITNGRAYIAPAGHHLLVDNGVVRLGRGPRENMSRPAVDPLFRSAALSHGARVIAVVLSGLLDDGAAGLSAVKRCGGITMVQNPADAVAEAMPLNALDACDVDYRVPAANMAQTLSRLAREPASTEIHFHRDIALEVEIARGRPSNTDLLTRIATPVALSCPSCSGVLSQIHEPSSLRFRCQIGHAYTAEALDKEQEAAVIQAMGVALRVLEERHTLMTKMAKDARRRGHVRSAQQFEERGLDYRQQADLLRKAVSDDTP
jgi:two-component system chemotaxis response regulator CheB